MFVENERSSSGNLYKKIVVAKRERKVETAEGKGMCDRVGADHAV